MSFHDGVAAQIAVAEQTDHPVLAAQLRAAANAVDALDAAHVSTALRELSLNMINGRGEIKMAQTDFEVVKRILDVAASGNHFPLLEVSGKHLSFD